MSTILWFLGGIISGSIASFIFVVYLVKLGKMGNRKSKRGGKDNKHEMTSMDNLSEEHDAEKYV